MRNRSFGLLALFAIGILVACGASSREVQIAKTARYKGDKLVLFNAAKQVALGKYKLAKSDETTLGFQTEPRWYTAEGISTNPRNDDMRDVPDGAINMTLVVTLLPDGDAWVVRVRPVMLKRLGFSPQPQKLEENDPSVPGWATGQVDQLALEIHQGLKQYELKSVPAQIGPPQAAPPPDEPAPTGASSPATPQTPPATPPAQ